MREIEFRGKCVLNNEWVYGSYFAHQKVNLCIITEQDEVEKNTQHLIVQDKIACDWNFENGIQVVDVNPKTVGQYTGLKDKNGTKIFEGDIIKCFRIGDKYKIKFARIGFDSGAGLTGFVCDDEEGWCKDIDFDTKEEFYECDRCVDLQQIEVIGNIYDDKDLLKEKQ